MTTTEGTDRPAFPPRGTNGATAEPAADPLSLKNLLFGGAKAPASESEGDTSLAEVRQELQTKLPNLKWADVSKDIDEKIDSILSCPIDEMLAGAWAKYKELQKYCDAEAYPPGKTVLAGLVKHRIEGAFTPSVVIQIATIDVANLELPIGLRLELEGIILKIESGRIMALQAGSLQGVGTVGFQLNMLRPKLPTRELFPSFEKKTPNVDLRAAIPFGKGIPIRRAAAEPERPTATDERRPATARDEPKPAAMVPDSFSPKGPAK